MNMITKICFFSFTEYNIITICFMRLDRDHRNFIQHRWLEYSKITWWAIFLVHFEDGHTYKERKLPKKKPLTFGNTFDTKQIGKATQSALWCTWCTLSVRHKLWQLSNRWHSRSSILRKACPLHYHK